MSKNEPNCPRRPGRPSMIKRSSQHPAHAITESADSDLPEGWVVVSVLDLAELIRGVSYAKGEAVKEPGPERIALLRANNIADELVFADLQYVPRARVSKAQMLCQGDVVVAMSSGSKLVVGKTATLKSKWDGTFGAFCGVLRPVAAVDPSFFGLYFRTREYRNAISSASSGTNINNLKRDYFAALPFPLPPLAEQKRIVAKVEELLARVNAARENLAKVPAILKRFRQSVLAAACSGRLTEEWREENQALENSAKSMPDQPANPELRSIPDTWRWVRLGALGADPRNPIQTGPFGAQLHRNEFVADGVPVVAVGNLTGMGFTHDGLYFITDSKARDLARYTVESGDILFARSGATLGKVCVAPPDARNWRMTGHILRARLDRKMVLPQIAVYALRGDPQVVEQVQGNTRGATRPGYNTSLLEEILIPLPSILEQHEIVLRVERLFALADSFEKQAAAAMVRVEKLPQAILAKAFRGELVPTEAEIARRGGAG